jgi:hypothetical protein
MSKGVGWGIASDSATDAAGQRRNGYRMSPKWGAKQVASITICRAFRGVEPVSPTWKSAEGAGKGWCRAEGRPFHRAEGWKPFAGVFNAWIPDESQRSPRGPPEESHEGPASRARGAHRGADVRRSRRRAPRWSCSLSAVADGARGPGLRARASRTRTSLLNRLSNSPAGCRANRKRGFWHQGPTASRPLRAPSQP